jgi:hypothetical protein
MQKFNFYRAVRSPASRVNAIIDTGKIVLNGIYPCRRAEQIDRPSPI